MYPIVSYIPEHSVGIQTKKTTGSATVHPEHIYFLFFNLWCYLYFLLYDMCVLYDVNEYYSCCCTICALYGHIMCVHVCKCSYPICATVSNNAGQNAFVIRFYVYSVYISSHIILFREQCRTTCDLPVTNYRISLTLLKGNVLFLRRVCDYFLVWTAACLLSLPMYPTCMLL